MIAHEAPLSGVAAGPGGLVATAGYDNRLILWQGRRALARAWHDHLVNQCAFDGSGRFLVSASSDYTARVWSVPDLRLLAVLGDHEDDVEMAVFDAAGARVATASRDHRVRVFTRGGQLLARCEGHTADVISVTWAQGDAVLVSSSDDGTVRHWDAATGALLRTLTLGAETDTVVAGPDGTLYAGDDHGDIICITATGTRRVPAHGAGIKRLTLDRAGRCLVSTSYDRTLRTWHVGPEGLEPRCRTTLPALIWARSATVDADGRILLGTFGSSYGIYDPSHDTWDFEGVEDTPGLNAVHVGARAVYAVGDAGRLLRNGAEVARVGSSCNFVTTWRGRAVAGGHLGALFDEAGRVLHQHTSPLNCATVLADGDLLVGTYTGEGLRLTETAGGVALQDTLRLHEQAVKGVAARGAVLFSVSAAGDAALHTFGADGVVTRRLPAAHDRIANGVCALKDGRFATVSRDRRLRLWTGDRAEVVETPHLHSIKCVAGTRDGRWVATGSYDGTIALYDLRAGRFGPVVRPTCSGISSLCAAAEPDAVLASAYDGQVYRVGADGAVTRPQWPRAARSKSTTRQPSGSAKVRLLPVQ